MPVTRALPASYIAFDCETSGLDPDTDEIIQLAAVRFENGQVAAEWSSLVRPKNPVSAGILRLTGLDPQELQAAPEPAEVLPAFRAFAGQLPLVAHNAPFDVA